MTPPEAKVRHNGVCISPTARDGAPRAGVPVDTGEKGAIPTITVEDTDQPTNGDDMKPAQAPPEPSAPGTYPSGPAPEIPDWYKVGWRAVAGVDVPQPQDEQSRDKAVLERFLSDQFYGAWYHDAGIIIFVCPIETRSFSFHFYWSSQ